MRERERETGTEDPIRCSESDNRKRPEVARGGCDPLVNANKQMEDQFVIDDHQATYTHCLSWSVKECNWELIKHHYLFLYS